MNIKFIFLSVLVLGLIVNTSSFSDFAFADKPDKEEKKGGPGQKKIQNSEAKAEREDAKAEREEVRAVAKAEREDAKIQKNEVKDFGGNVVVTSSSTTTICHIPPGNPANNHTITIGESAVSAHVGHGDIEMPCEDVIWEKSESNSNEENSNINENAIEQIRKQIESLQKQLQKLLGL